MPEEDKKITVRSKGPHLLRGAIPRRVSRKSCLKKVSHYHGKRMVRSAFTRAFAATLYPISRVCGVKGSDPEVLAQIIDKLDNCPSGALAYALENGDEIIEPDLAKEVVVIRRLEIAA